MNISDIIRPGDKINISPFPREGEEGGTKSSVIYRSMVMDVMHSGSIEIAVPSAGGGLVLLPLDEELQFEFLSKGGLYRAVGEVRERYKQDNVYMLRVELVSKLVKRQRREFFRYPCMYDMTCFMITPEEAEEETGQKIYEQITSEPDDLRTEYHATTLDISGGGVRFLLGEPAEQEQLLLLGIHLKSESIDKQFYLVATVLSCVQKEDRRNLYELRAQFWSLENSIREEIVRFIFEEERRSRRRS